MEAENQRSPRRALIVALLLVVGVGGLLAGFLYRRWAGGVTTDDAFLKADLVQVTAETGGRVTQVLVQENQPVKAGDLLVRIDDADYLLRVAQAEANLAAAQADARRAALAARASRSEVKVGQVRLADAQREDKLQHTLAEGGAAGVAVADRARTVQEIAAQTLTSAQAGAEANVAGADAASARVAAAQAALDLARRDVGLTEVRAACDGFAAKVDAAVGELVQKGTPLMVVVPGRVFLVANFKETDLPGIHVGDAVEVELDAYPDSPLTGHVESLGAGTGASFSLLPADNATGNFIKVVQRVPVRITLDQAEAQGRPLAVGLSAFVRIPRAEVGGV